MPSGYGDLGCSELADSDKKDCFAGELSVIARDVAISAVQRWQTNKIEIAALRSPPCHREVRSDLGFLPMADRDKRDCFAGELSVIARNVAISVVRGWRTEKREIAALRSQ